MDILPFICPWDTTDEKQYRSDRKFIPEELHNLFVRSRLWNQYNVIKVSKPINLAIGGSPPPTIKNFATIPKTTKAKTIYRPNKFP